MKPNRRQVLGLIPAGVTALVSSDADAKHEVGQREPKAPDDAVGLLYDATKCIGCKACVAECAAANDMIPDTALSGGLHQMPMELNSQTLNIIQLYQDETNGEESFMKRQCMHCLDPACVAGCPFHALDKGEKGIVAWDGSRCIGCRFCEVACPFEIPKFEWDSFNPEIVKCELCSHLLPEGKEPGCTSVCPTDAVVFGRRDNLLADAKSRIAEQPGRYYENRVYGENDGGGTQVLYLSHVPFEKLGLPKLAGTSVAYRANKYQRWLYKYLALPALIYAGLVAVIRRRWKKHDEHAQRIESQTGLQDQL